jgi:uncharacterized protein YdaT
MSTAVGSAATAETQTTAVFPGTSKAVRTVDSSSPGKLPITRDHDNNWDPRSANSSNNMATAESTEHYGQQHQQDTSNSRMSEAVGTSGTSNSSVASNFFKHRL